MNNCWLFHKWTKWVDKTEGTISVEGRSKGETLVQERRCEICNKAERRVEKLWYV